MIFLAAGAQRRYANAVMSENTNQSLGAQAFWSWFAANADRFIGLQPASAPCAELNEMIEALGFKSWEVGPAPEGGTFLAISPDGDPDRLALTRRITDAAPDIAGWTFLPAKPAKDWLRQFVWPRGRVEIDARNWTFTVYQFPDGMMDIVLLGAPFGDLPRDQKLDIIEFVVESEIGEALMIETVCSVDIEPAPDRSQLDNATPIAQLRQTIQTACRNEG